MALLLLICLCSGGDAQLNKFKVPRHRAGSSKFSLNPLKPLMNLMGRDTMKAAAQRQIPKYLPPPPNMYQQMAAPPSRASYGLHPYRPYPSHTTRVLPPTTVSLVPPLSPASSSMVFSALANDYHHHHHNSYRPQASDLQIKAVRIPSSKTRRPASFDSLNIADSVVRQLLDLQPAQQQQQQQQTEHNNFPSVLVIEDPDVASSSNSEIFGDSIRDSIRDSIQNHQKVLVAPPVHAELSSDTSDISTGSSSNPEVFVIVSKNKNKNSYYSDDKKSDILSSSSSSPKLKKYKITSAYDENGGRQVWIIKR